MPSAVQYFLDQRAAASGTFLPPARQLAVNPDASSLYLRQLIKSEWTTTLFRGPGDIDNFTHETQEIRSAYRRLLKEPTIKNAITSKINAVASRPMRVIPRDKKSPLDKKAAAFVDWSLKRSLGGVAGVIRAVGIGAMIDGHSVSQKWMEPSTDRMWPGFWTLKQLVPVDTQYLRFDLDPFKNKINIRGMQANGGEAFDPSQFVLYVFQQMFMSPFGTSDLRAAYRAANLIEAAVKLRAILLENFSGPFLIGKYQPGDQGQKTEMLQVLREARAMGYMAVPEGDEISVLNLAQSADAQFASAIEDYRKEIYTAINGSFLQFTEGAAGSERGSTKVHEDVAELRIWSLADEIASVINNQLIPDLVEPNFGKQAGMPMIVCGTKDIEQCTKFIANVKSAQSMGVETSLDQFYEESGLEPPEDADDMLPKPAPPQGGTPAGMPPGLPGQPPVTEPPVDDPDTGGEPPAQGPADSAPPADDLAASNLDPEKK